MVLSDYQASYWLKSDSHPPKNCSQHSMVMLLLARLVAHLARCESRRFVCLPPSCDSTVLSAARASSAFLRARLGLPPCLLTTFCHPLLAAYIVHPTTIHGVRQHRTCKEVPSHAEEERVNSYPFSPSASLPAPDARAVSATNPPLAQVQCDGRLECLGRIGRRERAARLHLSLGVLPR